MFTSMRVLNLVRRTRLTKGTVNVTPRCDSCNVRSPFPCRPRKIPIDLRLRHLPKVQIRRHTIRQFFNPRFNKTSTFRPDLQRPSIIIDFLPIRCRFLFAPTSRPQQGSVGTDKGEGFGGHEPPERLEVFGTEAFDEVDGVQETHAGSVTADFEEVGRCCGGTEGGVEGTDYAAMDGYFGYVIGEVEVACVVIRY